MKPLTLPAALIISAAAILWAALTLAAPTPPSLAPQTFAGPGYTVPPGVGLLRVEDVFTTLASETPCDNYPNTPSRMPCYIETHTVSTNTRGVRRWALQKWLLTATPTPTPTPRPSPACPGKILPNGKCKK